MLKVFLATLTPMLTMFVCILVGFVMKKGNLVPADTGTVISKLEAFVLCPALIISTFLRNCNAAAIAQNAQLMLYCTGVCIAELLIAIPLSRLFYKKGYLRNIYAYCLVVANYGFMGNAIVPVIFGQDALFEYMLFTTPMTILCYSWGLAQLIPGEKGIQGTLKRLFNPTMVSMVLGAVFGLTGAGSYIPGFLTSALSLLGNCMGPLAMILTGFVIGGFRISKLLGDPKVYIVSVIRLILLPGAICLALWALGASKMCVLLSLIAFGTPLGLNTVVYPAAYGSDTAPGASMAMISTTLCVVTIPMLFSLFSIIL